LQEDNNLTL